MANHSTERLTARAARLNSEDLLSELEDIIVRSAVAALRNDAADELLRIKDERKILRAEVARRLA